MGIPGQLTSLNMVARPRVTSVSNRPKQASFDSAVLTLWVVQEFPEIQESIFKGHTARVTALFNGDRSFPAAGPRICNSLPPELRRPDTELGEFRRLLKTFLFA